MNWDAIGAVAEALGSLGVLISLFYLATQIRLNTRQIKTSIESDQLSAFERNIEAGNRIREMFLIHPEIAELYERGNRDYASLDRVERFRYEQLLRNIFSAIQGAFIRQQSTTHDPEGTAGIAKIVDETLQAPGARQYISRADVDWRPEFKKFVNERLETVSASNKDSSPTNPG
jgi:hypothetical protein